MPDLTTTNLLLGIIAIVSICVGAAAVYACVVLSHVKEKIEGLYPQVQRIAYESEETIKKVRDLAVQLESISEDVKALTSETKTNVLPVVRTVGKVTKPVRQLSALIEGIKVGMTALGGRKKKDS